MKNTTDGFSRRDFLRSAASMGVLSAAAGTLAACSPKTQAATTDNGANTGQPDWLGAPREISASELTGSIDTEVLVIGAGTAGCFAACAAAEQGAKTIIIDKQEVLGNGIRDTLAALNSKQQQASGINPDPFDVIVEMTRQSSGYGDERLYRIWAEHSGETVDWYTERLAEHGREFKFEIDAPNHLKIPTYDVGHSFQWADPTDPDLGSFTYTGGLLLEYGKGKGLEVHMQTILLQFIKDGSRVVGIYADGPGGIVRYNASKGIVVCTGGYAANPEMMSALQPDTLDMASVNFSMPSSTGDGIRALLWAGGVMDPIHAGMIFDRGAVPPDSTDLGDGQLFWMGSQPFLKVDLDGNRFTNESGCYDFILHTANGIKDKTYCTVWDASYAEDIRRFDTHGCSRLYPHENGTLPVMPLTPVVDGMNADLQARGYIVEADTIEGLAAKLNIPTDAFAKTVRRYNELADSGVDSDFGKEPHRLSHLDTPPFRGVRQRGGYFIATLDGARINTDMQVLDVNGLPIEGLYAAGDCTGGYFGVSYVNLLSGAAAGRSVTFGRRAGQLAAKA
jgi:succinate dehydrogenase/fumarate reductase flavoprotein subunit